MKFGIVPYFVELLNSQLKNLEYFVAWLDEFFNCVAKKKQKKKKKITKTTTTKKKQRQQQKKTNGFAYLILGF